MLMPSIFGENLFDDDWMNFPFNDEFWGKKNPLYGKHAQNMMKTDIRETDGSYELDVDLPGFKKDEIKVQLKDGYLTLAAAKADLTDEQKNTMMKYFKADASQVQIITVNNQDERNYLGKYISSAQIGTRTLSCAYVKPTQSGGIKVRTANLNYVTCNMLANALSTAGVSNCEAVAACPYEVSGTGALTGVMMAYEAA